MVHSQMSQTGDAYMNVLITFLPICCLFQYRLLVSTHQTKLTKPDLEENAQTGDQAALVLLPIADWPVCLTTATVPFGTNTLAADQKMIKQGRCAARCCLSSVCTTAKNVQHVKLDLLRNM